jgi:hypothetical protein
MIKGVSMSKQLEILIKAELRLVQLQLDNLNTEKVRLEMALAEEKVNKE